MHTCVSVCVCVCVCVCACAFVCVVGLKWSLLRLTWFNFLGASGRFYFLLTFFLLTNPVYPPVVNQEQGTATSNSDR